MAQIPDTSSSPTTDPKIRLARLAPSAVNQRANQPPQPTGQCLGVRKGGGVCRATPTGDGYCPHHSPRFNADQRRQWQKRGALSLQHRRLAKERAAVAQQVATALPEAVSGSQAPATVPLPPVPDPTAPDWSDAKKIRLYLQNLAVQVAEGTITVSVAEMLRKLADSTLRVVDAELDAELMGQLDGGDVDPART